MRWRSSMPYQGNMDQAIKQWEAAYRIAARNPWR